MSVGGGFESTWHWTLSGLPSTMENSRWLRLTVGTSVRWLLHCVARRSVSRSVSWSISWSVVWPYPSRGGGPSRERNLGFRRGAGQNAPASEL